MGGGASITVQVGSGRESRENAVGWGGGRRRREHTSLGRWLKTEVWTSQGLAGREEVGGTSQPPEVAEERNDDIPRHRRGGGGGRNVAVAGGGRRKKR